MKKSIILGAALLLAGAFGQAHAAPTSATGKVSGIWIDPNGSGGFAFVLVGTGPQWPSAISVNANSITNPKVLSILLTAKTSDVTVIANYDNSNNILTALRFN